VRGREISWGTGIREADAENQSRNYFGRFDRVANSHRHMRLSITRWALQNNISSGSGPSSKIGSDSSDGPLSLVCLLPIGFLTLSLVFYVALVSSIYIFHKPARWAFLGILGCILLAYITHWICPTAHHS
jgi:hypothetical protein